MFQAVLNVVPKPAHIILMSTLYGRFYYPSFKDEETESQSG